MFEINSLKYHLLLVCILCLKLNFSLVSANWRFYCTLDSAWSTYFANWTCRIYRHCSYKKNLVSNFHFLFLVSRGPTFFYVGSRKYKISWVRTWRTHYRFPCRIFDRCLTSSSHSQFKEMFWLFVVRPRLFTHLKNQNKQEVNECEERENHTTKNI